ncbi:hypothetical protein ASY01nite_01710 [Acetobacter syzygii]|nr:hypothetical protein Absy_014_099 [Acetobacter syzygii]GBR63545.1 hypothetical protein AA0483_0925 [Acetobacter syzygii NRIC 0483]GEL55105.1 hypothetical protein ASY01nite_01710 [Acetobacter syzygii]
MAKTGRADQSVLRNLCTAMQADWRKKHPERLTPPNMEPLDKALNYKHRFVMEDHLANG